MMNRSACATIALAALLLVLSPPAAQGQGLLDSILQGVQSIVNGGSTGNATATPPAAAPTASANDTAPAGNGTKASSLASAQVSDPKGSQAILSNPKAKGVKGTKTDVKVKPSSGKGAQKVPLPRASGQGQAFCRNLLYFLNHCPAVPAVRNFNLDKFKGEWYVIGTNAQQAFSLWGLQGSQCNTRTYARNGQYAKKPVLKSTDKGIVFGNPWRQLESILVNQNAGSVGLGIRLICQFITGTEPLADVIPMLKGVSTAAGTISRLTDIRGYFDKQYTTAVRNVVQKNPDLKGLVAQGVTPRLGGVVNPIFSTQPTLQNPLALGTFTVISSYSAIGNQALTESVNVKGIINAISLGTIFASIPPAKLAKITAQSDLIQQAASRISMYSEQVYMALERMQRENQLLSGGKFGLNLLAANASASNISAQASRIGWLVRRMQQDRQRMYKAAGRLTVRLNGTGTDPQILQAAEALGAINGNNGPIKAALDYISSAVRDINTTVTEISPGFPLPRRFSDTAYATQDRPPWARFTVSRSSTNESSKFSVIELSGQAYGNYKLALVWNCASDFSTGLLPENQFALLSRTRTVPQSVVQRALKFLKNNGVLLGGHNTFVRVKQDPQSCSSLLVLP